MLAIAPADRTFILAGAGVSAESGIPTFRAVGGLCRNYRIEKLIARGLASRSPAGVGVLFHASARGFVGQTESGSLRPRQT
jgi:NAD-dependent SIR2 family protein deacetylase